jgi:hypothetical protein
MKIWSGLSLTSFVVLLSCDCSQVKVKAELLLAGVMMGAA